MDGTMIIILFICGIIIVGGVLFIRSLNEKEAKDKKAIQEAEAQGLPVDGESVGSDNELLRSINKQLVNQSNLLESIKSQLSFFVALTVIGLIISLFSFSSCS